MAIKPFLSRLFGFGREKTPQEEEEEVVREETLIAALPTPGPSLRLRQDHSLFKLWEFDQKMRDPHSPMPHILLDAPNLTALTGDEAQKELVRLQMEVNVSAKNRFTQINPPKKKPAPRKGPAAQEEEEEEEPPIPDLDAEVTIYITSGKQLSAWLLIYPPVGEGKELDRDMLTQALEEKNVSYGVDKALLDRLPEEHRRYFHLFLVAQGELPVDGKDGTVVDLYARKVEKKIPVDEYGQMDYTKLNLIQNVKMGEVICRIIPPTPGVAGISVLDQEIPAKDGKAAKAPQGRNTKVTEDGGALVSTTTGHVKFNGKGFDVHNVMEVDGNVDYAVGSINYVGDVHVHGDVRGGFSVQAMGDITVDGVVEGNVEAGGDLVVAKGIVGNEQTVIRAQNDLFAKYVEGARVFARNSLQTDCIMNSDVYSNGSVQVRSGRATIIGGRVRATREISAGTIGSQVEGTTEIVLGGLPCEEYERERLVGDIAAYEVDLEKTELQPDSPHKLTHLSNTRLKLSVSRKKLEQVERELQKYRENPDNKKNPGHLICDTAHGGTDITIGSVSQRLRQEVHPCHVRLKDGEIEFF